MAIKLDTSKFVKNLAQRNKLVPHLDKAIAQGEFEWKYEFPGPKVQDNAWHPSGDCTPSVYELYHQAVSPPEERRFPASLFKTFQVGHFWHQYLQFITVERLGFAGWDEIERTGEKSWGHREGTRPYCWVRGSADICPCSIPGHGDYLVDFKTMKSSDFKQNGMPNWCVAKYECQINIYMDLFDIDQALILCILKDSPHDMKEFAFSRNQPLIDAIYDKWHMVSDCLNAEVEPDPDFDIPLPLVGPSR
jgi:hypothetical protein